MVGVESLVVLLILRQEEMEEGPKKVKEQA